jgi:hypothetical protein
MDIINNDKNHLRLILDDLYRHNMADFTPLSGKQKVAVSIGSRSKRARTFFYAGRTIESAYKGAREKALKYAGELADGWDWALLAFVDHEENMNIDDFYADLEKTKRNYYRKGIAFDDLYQFAFLEQELNGAALFRYDENSRTVRFHDRNITRFLIDKKQIGQTMTTNSEGLRSIIVFTCKSVFWDGEIHDLRPDGLEANLRPHSTEREYLEKIMIRSAEYLAGTVKEDGSFVYGYFPWFGKKVPSYNTIRHCLSVMALLEVYRRAGGDGFRAAAEASYAFFMREFVKDSGPDASVVIDPVNGREVRLGALGLGIIAVLDRAEIFGSGEEVAIARRLGNQILQMQDFSGQFTHVLTYPDLETKAKFRIVYYSGEACYGLMKLYARTGEEKYLAAVERAFEFFIANNYEKYYDHWLSYATNELTKIRPDDRYFEFGLKNAFLRLDFIYDRLTTWPTFLELLNAAHLMLEHIKAIGRQYLLEPYDVDFFYKTMETRVARQQNGVMFPEMAMFFARPAQILYGVFIRHHSFRVRDDDVAHHLIGYSHFISNVQNNIQGQGRQAVSPALSGEAESKAESLASFSELS